MCPPSPEVQEWLASARYDLAYAELDPPEPARYEQGAFHAQQATEKALKALLIARGVDPPHTHSLQLLLDLVGEMLPLPDALVAVAALTRYAVFLRYPPFTQPVTESQWREAVSLARLALDWVSQHVVP
jgi:HEPN domain-containing protein